MMKLGASCFTVGVTGIHLAMENESSSSWEYNPLGLDDQNMAEYKRLLKMEYKKIDGKLKEEGFEGAIHLKNETDYTAAVANESSSNDLNKQADAAGHDVIALMRKKAKVAEGHYADVIYEHPKTGAKLYCGGSQASSSSVFHKAKNIYHIVNCRGEKDENSFENDGRYSYSRFPIMDWDSLYGLNPEYYDQEDDNPNMVTALKKIQCIFYGTLPCWCNVSLHRRVQFRKDHVLTVLTPHKLYCGGIQAAETQSYLDKHKIYHIVNCRGERDVNLFEKALLPSSRTRKYSYSRFLVMTFDGLEALYEEKYDWEKHNPSRDVVTNFVNPQLQFIDRALEDGKNVLIHCAAGAHRAGTMSVAFLMQAHGIGYQKALAMAKEKRDVIDPACFKNLKWFLEVYEDELRADGELFGEEE
eukprot:gene497-177_t